MPSQPIATWTTPCSSRKVVAAGTSRRRQTIGLTCSSRTFSWRAGPALGRSGSTGSAGKDALAVFSCRDATGRQRRLPASAPRFLMLPNSTDETPTAVMVRQILGAVAQFEKAGLVQKLRHARERKRAETGRCEGRKPVPEAVVREAKRLARKSPKTGKVRSLREIAGELAKLGHLAPSGKPYEAMSVKRMLER